jgi:hypothetical protein
MCTEVEQANSTNAYLDNGWYVGHDEPSMEFLSNLDCRFDNSIEGFGGWISGRGSCS